jgi:hypothetical protein
MKLIEELKRGEKLQIKFARFCALFDISAVTGYRWLRDRKITAQVNPHSGLIYIPGDVVLALWNEQQVYSPNFNNLKNIEKMEKARAGKIKLSSKACDDGESYAANL